MSTCPLPVSPASKVRLSPAVTAIAPSSTMLGAVSQLGSSDGPPSVTDAPGSTVMAPKAAPPAVPTSSDEALSTLRFIAPETLAN